MKRREQNDLTFISGDVILYMYYYENCYTLCCLFGVTTAGVTGKEM